MALDASMETNVHIQAIGFIVDADIMLRRKKKSDDENGLAAQS